MQPRVTAVLVARNGAEYLPRTLASIEAQLRRPDEVLVVDSGSTDASASLLAGTGSVITTPGRASFGGAVDHALRMGEPQQREDEWVWLLGHDNAPEPGALSALLGAVEVAPSVAIAGPKLMRWDDPTIIAAFGETVTTLGRSVQLVTDELDQAQYDVQSDYLAVAAGGMLVRRSVWTALGGFDPGLSSADAALDFSVRARLAGYRVVGVPAARVASAGPPEVFGRRSLSAGAQNRIRRFAQLHRRLVWAPLAAVPLHWLSLLPLAIARSIGHIVAKRPGSVPGELAAAIAAAFDGGVAPARRRIRHTRSLWPAIAPLRMSGAEVRERRAQERAAAVIAVSGLRERPGFFASGGGWMVLIAAVLGMIAFGRFVGVASLAGGGLAPLSSTVEGLWSTIGYGWHDIGGGFVGASDPFAAVLAVLGSLTFWAPSQSIVLLYLAALPLAALAAWWCAAAFSRRGWAPTFAAIAWAIAPPFLTSLAGGHLGAVIAHILLPTLVLALFRASRSWAMAGVAALLFAAVCASAPILAAPVVLLWFAWMVARPRAIPRLLGVPLLTVALALPLVIDQVQRGTVLALLAEPGVPVLREAPSGWQLALGSAGDQLAGWEQLLASLGLAPAMAPIVLIVLLAPLAVLALLALFLPGTVRSVPALAIAFLGFVTAVAATHIEVTLVGSQATPVWPGAALSLYWLGLIGGAVVALETLATRAAIPAWIAGAALLAVAAPLVVASASGSIAVRESSGRLLPAFVTAEASTRPDLGTLALSAQGDGGLAVDLHRGEGTTLNEQSTLAATDATADESELRLATLAGNLASRSGFDIAAELDDLQIGFVILTPAADSIEASATAQRAAESLDGNRLLTPVGDTAQGFLWAYEGLADGQAPTGPGPLETQWGTTVLIGQGVVLLVTILLAIPTERRRRVRTASTAKRRDSEASVAPADDGPPDDAAGDAIPSIESGERTEVTRDE
ncbi:GT2 family glycosyltransferase [Microbacteriaceae bacterium SG_E_30_P1]|uniref:GT2 family glycosyltransferase n=1 Tax=Antiquaquibacter oligotrophicus TaxID=2880260 RepID=A0ABT6KQ97_9MICO|nr:glycosyltransferase family 2 protein [Antiquaquibacter oligotrophicus]MDH6181673.1 GT2 family glycosyltransferase [Antiquaquibacter oligotrophicus]UDF12643.1 glycosyltransferase family 2 protein [Antiquaquibacter oligotrophicus]